MKFEITYITIADNEGEEVNLNYEEVENINSCLKKYNYHLGLGIK
jgi:hypothetical protein